MFSWKLRPSFRQELTLGSEAAQEQIVENVQTRHPDIEVKTFPNFVCLRIPEEDRHFWSPRLIISFYANESGGSRAQGTFGPNANVWALYLYGYLIVGLIAMFSGMLGVSQLLVRNMSPWGLWIFSGSLAIALALYLASRVGQRIASPQSDLLEQIYVEAIGQKIAVR